MNTLVSKIEAVMTGREAHPDRLLSAVLWLLSLLFGVGVKLRNSLYRFGVLRQQHLPCAVISIGNITAGGTGKTPLTLYVAKLLQARGYRTAVISRGYRGSYENQGGIVSDGDALLMTAQEAGDEPFLLATNLKTIPVIVGSNRYKAGQLAISHFNPDVIVLDDAFQHRALARNLDLVLLDYRNPLGNGHLMPRGILREPPGGLARADALIFTRVDLPAVSTTTPPYPSQTEVPVFKAAHEPEVAAVLPAGDTTPYYRSAPAVRLSLQDLDGKTGLVFSGIARNADFQQTIRDTGCRLGAHFAFPDHHRYTDAELDAIRRKAESITAEVIITTEKDMARITDQRAWPADLWVIRVNLSFIEGQESWDRFLVDKVKAAVKNSEKYPP